MILPIAYIALGDSEESPSQNLVRATYDESQLYTATILQAYSAIGSVKLEAVNAAVKLWDITINFKNGRTQKVELRGTIYDNSESPFIDLEEEGGIKTITFSMNARRLSYKTPVIWIWGL